LRKHPSIQPVPLFSPRGIARSTRNILIAFVAAGPSACINCGKQAANQIVGTDQMIKISPHGSSTHKLMLPASWREALRSVVAPAANELRLSRLFGVVATLGACHEDPCNAFQC
jgi:hypothetical protein